MLNYWCCKSYLLCDVLSSCGIMWEHMHVYVNEGKMEHSHKTGYKCMPVHLCVQSEYSHFPSLFSLATCVPSYVLTTGWLKVWSWFVVVSSHKLSKPQICLEVHWSLENKGHTRLSTTYPPFWSLKSTSF